MTWGPRRRRSCWKLSSSPHCSVWAVWAAMCVLCRAVCVVLCVSCCVLLCCAMLWVAPCCIVLCVACCVVLCCVCCVAPSCPCTQTLCRHRGWGGPPTQAAAPSPEQASSRISCGYFKPLEPHSSKWKLPRERVAAGRPSQPRVPAQGWGPGASERGAPHRSFQPFSARG